MLMDMSFREIKKRPGIRGAFGLFRFFALQQAHKNDNQDKSNQGQEWNCNKTKPVNILARARHAAYTRLNAAKAGHFLL